MDMMTKRKALSLSLGALTVTALGGLLAGCGKKEAPPAQVQAQSKPMTKEEWAKEHGYTVTPAPNGGGTR